MSIIITEPESIDPAVQRQVFGALPTGVTAITGLTQDGTPRGFVVGTFQSLSLDPPLVTFCVDKGDEKFKDVAYTESAIGTPRIDGAAAWADCEVLSEVVAGDHYMIVGAIVNLEAGQGDALLFRGGKFGDFNLWPAPAPNPTTASAAQPLATAAGKA
jgi:flavin reductase (DIM6/NTAB) family NADH-FMN oxidoreductase RutF